MKLQKLKLSKITEEASLKVCRKTPKKDDKHVKNKTNTKEIREAQIELQKHKVSKKAPKKQGKHRLWRNNQERR